MGEGIVDGVYVGIGYERFVAVERALDTMLVRERLRAVLVARRDGYDARSGDIARGTDEGHGRDARRAEDANSHGSVGHGGGITTFFNPLPATFRTWELRHLARAPPAGEDAQRPVPVARDRHSAAPP